MGQILYNFFFSGISGDIANYLGLLLTLVGFYLTYKEARKSREQSKEAQKEVIKVREDINKIDLINDLSSAIAIIEEIRTLQRKSMWTLLPDRYTILKKLLISIKTTYPKLSDQHKSLIQSTIQHVSDIDHKIELALQTNSEPINIPKANRLLSIQKDSVYEMLVELRNSIGVNKQ